MRQVSTVETTDIIGYMRITDLGIARVWNPENAKDTSGTPGYMGKYFTFLSYCCDF